MKGVLSIIILSLTLLSCEKKVYTPKISPKSAEELLREQNSDINKNFAESSSENSDNNIINSNTEISDANSKTNQNILDEANQAKLEKNYTKALKLFLDVLDKEPNNTTILENIADIYIALKKYSDAIEYAEKILKLNPNNQFALILLANSYLEKNSLSIAMEYYKKLESLSPSFTIYYNIGVIYERQFKYLDALSYFEKAAKKTPNAEIYYSLAVISEKLKRDEQTIEYLKKSLKYNKHSLPTRRFLVKILLDSGKNDEAAENIEHLLKENKISDYQIAASIYKSQKNIKKAIEIYEAGKKLDGVNDDYIYNLGLCYEEDKNRGKLESLISEAKSMTLKRKLKVLLDKIKK
ncbi:tetratricopeptide repeat protein [bacterium]|nr:tetratricopeptide repeat protein [bacterium]